MFFWHVSCSKAKQRDQLPCNGATRQKKLLKGSDESARFHPEPIELAHSFVLKSEDQVVLHFLFFPDKGQRFTPQPGELKMKFILEAKTHQRRTLRLEPLERRVTLTEQDVETLRSSQVLGLLSWHLESC
jgi:hypothetical protein